jgi:aspartyl/glutamyl-tRNA(Asn/Gln) amidotransferase C subunit
LSEISETIFLWYDAVIMTKEEIRTLGSLARVALTESEVEAFNQEIESILEYVSAVKDMAGSAPEAATQDLGARFNVLRPDMVTNVPGQYTEAILAEMPATSGQFLAV